MFSSLNVVFLHWMSQRAKHVQFASIIMYVVLLLRQTLEKTLRAEFVHHRSLFLIPAQNNSKP
jgi:hypothetical protein